MPLSAHAPPQPSPAPVRPLAPPQLVRRISAWPFLSGRDEVPAADIAGNARRVIAITARLYREPLAELAAPQARRG